MTRLDRIDLKILTQLESDGRISNSQLSDRVGLSPSPCLQRVKRLEDAGVIKRYRAEIDWNRVCNYLSVVAKVSLKTHTASHVLAFERLVAQMPEVSHCYALSGDINYIIHFICPDMASYERAIGRVTTAQVSIESISSHVVMREIKVDTRFPLHERTFGAEIPSCKPQAAVGQRLAAGEPLREHVPLAATA
jgi:DNA-binding Lrp family transcriptional regulator